MNSISKYIFRQTAIVMVFLTIVLSFVIWLTQSLRFVDMVVNRGLPMTDFLWLALLILPRFLSVILPVACVIATVYVYNRLINDRELIVLRAAGASNLGLARSAILLAVATGIAVYALNIYLLPVSYRQFTDLRYTIRSDYSSILLQEGAFHTLPSRITIFVRERGGAGQLNGILVHDGRNPSQPVTLMAESGALVETDSGPRVVLINGNRQQIDRATGSVSFLDFEKYTVDLRLTDGSIPAARQRNPEELYLWELFDPAITGGPRRSEFIAEAHSRIASPFLALAFVLVSLSILLSGDFSRRGQHRRVLLALTLVVVLQTTGIASLNVAQDNLLLIPLLYANVSVPALIGLFALGPATARRGRRSRPDRAMIAGAAGR